MKISISIRSLLIALIGLTSTTAMAEETRMQVSVASTPVYTQPSAGAQQLGNASSGEIVFVSRIDGEWAAIAPLDRHSVWLNKDFVEGNRVIAKSIQVRSGPGVQYDVVGSLERGAPVMPLGEEGEWCKIAPPSSATLWVRARDLSGIATHTTPIREVATVTTPEITTQPVPEPTPPPSSSTVSAELPPPDSPVPPPPATPEPPPVQVTEVASTPPSSEPPPPPSSSTIKVAPSIPPAPKPLTRPTPWPQTAPSPMASGAAPARPVTTPAHPPANPPPTLRPAIALPATKPNPIPPQPQTLAKPVPIRPGTVLRPTSKTIPTPPTVVTAHKSKAPEVQVEQSLVDDLELDNEIPTQGKAVQVEGELRNAPFMAGSPSRYRLVTREDGILEMVCHVHGHSDILREYVGKGVSIRGREFWVETSDMPVVVVGQIVPLSPASEPVMF